MKIIMPIGISGSGKSRLYNMKYSDLSVVSPDQIRKELTGNISNQSRNKDVFREVDKRVDEFVSKGESFFYDATNLNTELRKKFVNKFADRDDIEIIYIVLPADVNLSFKRINANIDNNVDRSKVPYDVLLRQYAMYKSSLNSHFAGENVKEVIYM